MTTLSKFALLAMALMFAVCACSPFPERPPAPALHDFGWSEKVLKSQAGGVKASGWSTVSVDAPVWLQNENIRYRLLYADPTRVRFYAQDRWLASPPSMLAQRLALLSGKSGWQLKIKLLEFEQVFDEAQKARVILTFRALVQWPDSEEIVGEKLFSFSRISPAADAKGAVIASAMLVDEAVDSLQAWFGQLPGSH